MKRWISSGAAAAAAAMIAIAIASPAAAGSANVSNGSCGAAISNSTTSDKAWTSLIGGSCTLATRHQAVHNGEGAHWTTWYGGASAAYPELVRSQHRLGTIVFDLWP